MVGKVIPRLWTKGPRQVTQGLKQCLVESMLERVKLGLKESKKFRAPTNERIS